MLLNCGKFREFEKMFQGISDALKSAAEIIAPAPTLCQELEYHWKQVKKFYTDTNVSSSSSSRHISSTNLPHHLEKILQTLIQEDNDIENNSATKECLEFILINRPIDLLLQLSISDNPPGMKICVLNWLRRFLSCLKNPPLEHASIFQPIRNFIRICNGIIPSPYEQEEILFLETVAGLIRKNPFLLDIFLPHQHSAAVSSSLKGTRIKKLPIQNPLFQSNTKIEENIINNHVVIVPNDNNNKFNKNKIGSEQNDSNCDINININKIQSEIIDSNRIICCDCEENDRFHLLDAILTYFQSPDSEIVVRACEGALILTSLPTIDMNCIGILASLNSFITYLIQKIINLYENIPNDMDTDNLEDMIVSWGLTPREPDDHQFIGKSQVYEFLCWFDYTDCVARECLQVGELLRKFRTEFLMKYVESTLIATDTPFVLVLLSKMIKQIHSTKLMNEISIWLIGDAIHTEEELLTSTDCLLTIIIENIQDNCEILLAGLQFIEALLDNPHECILNEMIFRYINKRGYYETCKVCSIQQQNWSDQEEKDARILHHHNNVDEQIKSKTLSPYNILRVINNYLLLLPRQIMAESGGTCYEEYVQDASRHYKIWTEKTKNFNWPHEALTPDHHRNHIIYSASVSPEPFSTTMNLIQRSNSEPSFLNKCNLQCNNDSGISEETFYEGALLRLLFTHVRNMATQTCEINLAIIAILSKLAFLPHPYLHEILLNPEIPISAGASTLWINLKFVARQLLVEIPKYENFQKRIGITSKHLLLNQSDTNLNETEITDELVPDDAEQLFEAIVILEEFCKELAAIAFVKYHHATE